MPTTITLPDDIAEELKSLPNPDSFVASLLRAVLQQRKPISKISITENASTFWQPKPLDYYLQNQKPVRNIADLDTDFWPEDESIDDFVKFIRQQRREDAEQSA